MTSEQWADGDSVYKLQEDVIMSYSPVSESSRILKLNNDDVFYEATLVAGEIVKSINGKDSFNSIVQKVAALYSDGHFEDIRGRAIKLFVDLLEKELIKKVK